MIEKVKLYGHVTCPKVPPVRVLLAKSKVEYEYLDVRKDRQAAATLREINNGFESVPTLVFPDGSKLTEPSVNELKAKLELLGYKVGPAAWLIGSPWLLAIAVLVLLAVLRIAGIL